MIKFDEQKQLDSTAGALAIRKEIERIAEDVTARGFSNLCNLGIGGTYASALPRMPPCTTPPAIAGSVKTPWACCPPSPAPPRRS